MAVKDEAYVLGLLVELEDRVAELQEQLRSGRQRARAVETELSDLLQRLDLAKGEAADAHALAARCSAQVTAGNEQVAALHQQIGTLRRRVDSIKAEMDRQQEAQGRRRLRRERGRLLVEIEDREAEVTQLREAIDTHRTTLQAAERDATTGRQRSEAIAKELDALQVQLPSPYLYADSFLATAARAHCRYLLDGSPATWREENRQAVSYCIELHADLRAGKYRLDRNSELVGGRHTATAEALYAAVAIGDLELAVELFELATDPSLLFHQIFNVFRSWCLGLWACNRHDELRELLHPHRFSEGLRGAYVQAFAGLLARDAGGVQQGVRDICRYERALWQEPGWVRGVGVVNLGALAVLRLAEACNLAVKSPDANVPIELLRLG